LLATWRRCPVPPWPTMARAIPMRSRQSARRRRPGKVAHFRNQHVETRQSLPRKCFSRCLRGEHATSKPCCRLPGRAQAIKRTGGIDTGRSGRTRDT
jgi:hypothetical protein